MKNNNILNLWAGVILSSLFNTLNVFIKLIFCTGGIAALVPLSVQLIFYAILSYVSYDYYIKLYKNQMKSPDEMSARMNT